MSPRWMCPPCPRSLRLLPTHVPIPITPPVSPSFPQLQPANPEAPMGGLEPPQPHPTTIPTAVPPLAPHTPPPLPRLSRRHRGHVRAEMGNLRVMRCCRQAGRGGCLHPCLPMRHFLGRRRGRSRARRGEGETHSPPHPAGEGRAAPAPLAPGKGTGGQTRQQATAGHTRARGESWAGRIGEDAPCVCARTHVWVQEHHCAKRTRMCRYA